MNGQRIHLSRAGSEFRLRACARSPCSFPPRGGDHATYPSCVPAPPGEVRPPRSCSDADALLEVPPISNCRPARPHLAEPRHRARTDLVLDRPPRRKPGSRQADGLDAQAAHVRSARPARCEGDRGRLPVRLADGLRIRAQADRRGSHPRRHDDRRADAGAARADRADLRSDRGRTARDRAPLQLDVDHAAPRRLPAGRGRSRGSRRSGDCAVQGARGAERDEGHVRVLTREFPRHRARVRPRDLRGGHGGVAADAGRADDRQPADDGRGVSAERLRGPHRVVPAARLEPRQHRPERSPAQRPGDGRRDRRARPDGRSRPGRRDAVRERRADRQRGPRDDCSEPADAGRRSRARSVTARRGEGDRRGMQRAADPPTASLGRRARLHGLFRVAPGRDQERDARTATRELGGRGTSRTCRSTRPISAATTRRSSGSTRSPARAESPT